VATAICLLTVVACDDASVRDAKDDIKLRLLDGGSAKFDVE